MTTKETPDESAKHRRKATTGHRGEGKERRTRMGAEAFTRGVKMSPREE